MSGSYLPSAQFVVIVTAIALSGGLVLAAQYVTSDARTPSTLTSSNTTDTQNNSDWKTALYDVQGISPLDIEGSSTVQVGINTLVAAAQTTNVTDTIGRSLLLNLSDARAQGLGSDIPTQEKLIDQAAQYLNTNTATTYTTPDLTVVSNSTDLLRTYGNSFIAIMKNHPKANIPDTYVAIGQAVDTGDKTQLVALANISKEYQAIVKELLALPVPQTLSPLHLQIINNFSRIAASYTDMQAITTDPLRGLGGVQTFNALTEETTRMFTNIAQSFSKNAILFNKDEPGSAWSLFLPQ